VFFRITIGAAWFASLFVTGTLSAQNGVEVPQTLTFKAAEALLQNNPALLAKRLEIDMENGDVIDSEKYPNPSISVTFDGMVFDSSRGSWLDRMQPQFLFNQELVLSDKLEKRKRVEVADTEIAEIEVQDLYRQLKFDLKRAYFQVVLAQRDLELVRKILNRFQGVVALNRTRYQAGEISGGELRRSEAAEYRFFSEVADAEVRLENARTDLLAIIGSLDLSRNFTAADDFDSGFVPPPQSELREIALRQRPDLAASRARANQAQMRIALESARSKPNLNLFGGYKRELDSNGPVAGVNLPLFVFNRNQGPLYRAQAGFRRQENRVLFRRILVLREVQIALQQLEGQRKKIRVLESDYLEKAREAREITESSYRLGEASLIEFLDAERTFSEIMLLYNRALYDFQISRGRLELAIGEDL